MKRLLSMTLVICYLFAFCACGSSGQPAPATTAAATQAAPAASAATTPAAPATEAPKTEAAPAAPSITLQLAHTVAEDPTHPYTVAANTFKEKLEELSGGTIAVDVYPGGQLGGDADILQGLQLGSISCGVLSSPVIANVTNVMVACDMPFLFNDDYDVLKKVQGGELGDYMLKRLNEEVEGIYAVSFLYQGFRHIWANKPVNSLADMKGLKFRCMQTPIHLAIFNALGTNPTSIAYNDIYASMQSGTIDAFEMDVFGAQSNKFYEVCKNMTKSGHFNNSDIMIFSKMVYDSLTDEQKGWVEEAADAAAEASWQATVDGEASITAFLESQGVNIIEIDLSEFKAAEESVIQSYSDSVPEVKYVIDGMKEMGLLN